MTSAAQGPLSIVPDVSRTDLLYTKLGQTIDKIHELGRKMAQEFTVLGDCQIELKHRGVEITPEFPEFVLTALSVYRREQERQAVEAEKGGRG